MHFFDTHCHIQHSRFDDDRDEIIATALTENVTMLAVGSDLASSALAVELAAKHQNVYAAIGVHPCDAGDFVDTAPLKNLYQRAEKREKIIAIGETGLDYYHRHCTPELQKNAFTQQIKLAQELDLPLVLHARDSAHEVLAMITPFVKNGGRAVWHCYSASKNNLPALTEQAIDLGLYFGISGMITYEEQRALRAQIERIPDKHLLLDTDAPYLLLRPRTMERNSPIECRRIAETLAHLRGVRVEDMARITTRNACELFKMPTPNNTAQIAYSIRDSLYLNITNQCNNNCVFCARTKSYVVKGHDLKLAREPSAPEVIEAMGNLSPYNEVVFCGFGEPTLRLPELKLIAQTIKTQNKPVRLNTNGLANLQYGRNIAEELRGLIDTVSISLNSANPQQYRELCRSNFGEAAFSAMQEFTRCCLQAGIKTILTVVAMPNIEIGAAEKLARQLGAEFRVRGFTDAG